MGRPSTFNKTIGDRICARIAQGESVRGMCRDADMPSEASVYKWRNDYPDFAESYARARSSQTEHLLEDILEIADSPTIASDDKRVRIDARKWAMAKLAPKRYGESQRHEITGEGGGPIEIASNIGVALSAVRELRTLRGDAGLLPAPPEDHSDIL